MRIEQKIWKGGPWEAHFSDPSFDAHQAQLVMVFGDRLAIMEPQRYAEVRAAYPAAEIVFASTAGEILGDKVMDGIITCTAIWFEKTVVKAAETLMDSPTSLRQAGKMLAEKMLAPDLKHLLIISDGQTVNGSDLVAGLNEVLAQKVLVTGGLAGDGVNFTQTAVGLNRVPDSGRVVAVGLYGDHIQVGHGSRGGWNAFGPVRRITRSEGNVLYELDGESALALYKRYLGDRANELPGAALLFPLCILREGEGQPLVRTILSVDEASQTMTFAGNLPQDSQVQFMKANFDRIIDGAQMAAEDATSSLGGGSPELALLISCVGRKAILGQRAEEEVEEVCSHLGKQTVVTGFYSYGEISPFVNEINCQLHNQTMTITTLFES
jgi:hypothetical protein